VPADFFYPLRHANLPHGEDIMARRISTLLMLVVLAVASVRSQQASLAQQPVGAARRIEHAMTIC